MVSQVAQAQTSTTGLWSQMVFEMAKLGPMAQMYMAWRAAPYMLSGVVPSGAAQVIAATDYSQAAIASIARMTAIMVKLGFVKLVASITSQCVRQDRPDAVAKVSVEMMLAAEVAAMTDITNEMVARGDISDATYICKAMAENGHEEFMEMVAKEQLPESVKNAKEKVDGAIAWVTGKDTSADKKSAAESTKEQASAEHNKQQGDGRSAQQENSQAQQSESKSENLTAASIA